MRLSKVQKCLKENDIAFTYEEQCGCGTVNFIYNDKRYTVAEYTGVSGSTVKGILTNISRVQSRGPSMRDVYNQRTVCQLITYLKGE